MQMFGNCGQPAAYRNVGVQNRVSLQHLVLVNSLLSYQKADMKCLTRD